MFCVALVVTGLGAEKTTSGYQPGVGKKLLGSDRLDEWREPPGLSQGFGRITFAVKDI